jgi:hypothetical protein
VRIDEAGDDDHPIAIDFPSIDRTNIRSHLRDLCPVNQQIRSQEIPDLEIHRYDHRISDYGALHRFLSST